MFFYHFFIPEFPLSFCIFTCSFSLSPSGSPKATITFSLLLSFRFPQSYYNCIYRTLSSLTLSLPCYLNLSHSLILITLHPFSPLLCCSISFPSLSLFPIPIASSLPFFFLLATFSPLPYFLLTNQFRSLRGQCYRGAELYCSVAEYFASQLSPLKMICVGSFVLL